MDTIQNQNILFPISPSCPKDYYSLLADTTEKGFLFFNNFNIPEEIHSYFFDKENYNPESDGEPDSQEIPLIPEPYSAILSKALITRFPFLSDAKSIEWDSKIMYKNYKLNMHREYLYVDTTQQKSEITPFFFMSWITPYPYSGRELVWGKLNNINDQGPLVCNGKSMEGLDFDHPAVTTLGKLQPKTGMCCFLDRVDPKWWHAVDRMTDGGPVVLIGAYIRY